MDSNDVKIQEAVGSFAMHTIAQDRAANAADGNRHAQGILAAFDALAEIGDDGREGLAILLQHEEPRVRCMAAVFLLRYKHEAAMNVLRELARGNGLVAFAAEQSIKNWEDGSWELDPG